MGGSTFRNKNFLYLCLSQATTWFGNALHQIAFNYFLFSETKSAMVVGNSLVFAFLPSIVFSPIIGYLVDKYPKKRILIISDIVRALVTMLIPLFIGKSTYFFYIIQFVLATFTIPFSIGQKAIMGEILKEDELVNGNGLISSIKSFFKILGPAIAGIIVATLNIKYVFFVNSITFIISACFISLIFNTNNANVEREINKKPEDFNLNEYIVIVFDIFKTGVLRHTFLVDMFFGNIIAGASNVLILVWIEKYLNAGSKEYGILSSAYALGFFLGSMIISKVKHNYKNMVFFNLVCVFLSVTFMVFAITKNIYIAYAMRVCVGSSFVIISIISNSLFQIYISKDKYGKVFSVTELADNLFSILAIYVFGLLVVYVEAHILFLISGVLLLIYVLIIYFSTFIKGLINGNKIGVNEFLEIFKQQ